jgi:sterol desaturase/sphingolipid hydroxylase (fatty acid hydroxylase superfamily)
MDQDVIIRVSAFAILLVIMLFCEQLIPRRQFMTYHRNRQITNILLLITDVVLARLLLPVAVVGTAIIAEDRSWGLFNYISIYPLVEFCIVLVLLDVIIYGQHVVFHKIPVLWRIHRVHHTDPEVDVTTGFRFHPFEIILSLLLKMLVVIMLGAPVMAVLVFELLLNLLSMFNHGNIKLPVSLDQKLRLILVTPDMHRVHHSMEKVETNSNYGFCLPVWDRVFGTYQDQPALGHTGMKIGLNEFNADESISLWKLLIQPFVNIQKFQPEHTV